MNKILWLSILIMEMLAVVCVANELPEAEKNQVSLVSVVNGDKGGLAERIAINSAGTTVALGERDGTIVIRDLVTGKLVNTVPAHAHQVMLLSFSKNGKLLVSCDRETVKVWDVQTWKEIATVKENIACRPVLYGLAVDIETGDDHSNELFGKEFIDDIAFSDNSNFMAASGRWGIFQAWETATWKKVVSRQFDQALGKFGDDGYGNHVISPDGELLAKITNYAMAYANGIEITGLQKYRPLVTLKSSYQKPFRSLIFTRDGKFLIANDNDDLVGMWEVGSWIDNRTIEKSKK